jgi:8-oxo-dGTP pyrophosphatase MutT (NUDIX family)
VIRHRPAPELLVFDHVDTPEAGTQVPAGGVDPDEGLVEAALREVVEETGLLTATVVRQFAVEDTSHPDTGSHDEPLSSTSAPQRAHPMPGNTTFTETESTPASPSPAGSSPSP